MEEREQARPTAGELGSPAPWWISSVTSGGIFHLEWLPGLPRNGASAAGEQRRGGSDLLGYATGGACCEAVKSICFCLKIDLGFIGIISIVLENPYIVNLKRFAGFFNLLILKEKQNKTKNKSVSFAPD